MIDRVIQRRSLIDAMFAEREMKGLSSQQKIKIRSLVFHYNDWEILIALRDCLDPFEKITTVLSGDYATQAMSYFALQTLKESVQQKSIKSHYHAIINKSLQFQCDYYLDSFLPAAQKLGMKMSSFSLILSGSCFLLNKL